MTAQDFFFCYNKKTMKYLRYDKGFEFITKAFTKEGVEFWLFYITP
ncbi:hypothetical protein [Bacillus sp. FJAT-50079]|nr:hypothetical protein [Bacillus sp. FJAT-50079]MBS4207469.1 hypothetical protein [Bacillus sp. FJAT-50079]